MSNELTGAGQRLRGQERRIAEAIFSAQRDALKLVGQLGATEYMIPTGRRGRRARPDVPVDPVRLTWRTGALARSLTRTDDPDNIMRTLNEAAGRYTALLGTRKPYARIHELGGTTRAHEIAITDKMRSFFWAKHREEMGGTFKGDSKWKWMALTTKGIIDHPGSTMKRRPFLRPAAQDPRSVENARKILGKRATAAVAEALRAAFGAGGGRTR